jgi:DNA-binding Lrp family transcriptional regulator
VSGRVAHTVIRDRQERRAFAVDGRARNVFAAAGRIGRMVHAYVMLKTAAGESGTLLSQLADVAEIAEAHIVAGDYDIIAELEAEEVYDVLQSVASTLGAMDGIEDTKTYVALD